MHNLYILQNIENINGFITIHVIATSIPPMVFLLSFKLWCCFRVLSEIEFINSDKTRKWLHFLLQNFIF